MIYIYEQELDERANTRKSSKIKNNSTAALYISNVCLLGYGLVAIRETWTLESGQ